MYTIKFYVRGHPHSMTIDDEVLYDNRINNLFFSNPNSNNPSLWGVLIEKAWAKLLMNYTNMNSGYSHIALKSILGCPVRSYNLKRTNLSDK